MVMHGARVLRLGGRAAPGLAVIVVEVPLAADGVFRVFHQHLVRSAHLAVEELHQPLLAPGKNIGRLVAGRIEMLAVDHQPGDARAPPGLVQLLVEAPFVGRLVLDGAGVILEQQRFDILRYRTRAGSVADGDVMHGVAIRAQLARKVAHGREDGQDFLRVMQHVIRFLAHFHQDVDGRVIDLAKPAVAGIELVAQYQAQGGLG